MPGDSTVQGLLTAPCGAGPVTAPALAAHSSARAPPALTGLSTSASTAASPRFPPCPSECLRPRFGPGPGVVFLFC